MRSAVQHHFTPQSLIKVDSGRSIPRARLSLAQSSIAVGTLRSATLALPFASWTYPSARPSMLKFLEPRTFHPQVCQVDANYCRYDSQLGGYIFPESSTSSLPVVEIGLGDPNSDGGEQRFSLYPADIAFAEAKTG